MTKAEKTNQSNAICGNCGATAGGAYCPVCGQDTKLGPPTVAEYSHELIAHFIHLDGKILRNLGTLFFVPGKLPNDYLANKRARYVRPLRLYLAMIAIAFTVVQFLRWDLGLRFGGHRFNFLHVPRTAQDRSSADTVPLVLEYIDRRAFGTSKRYRRKNSSPLLNWANCCANCARIKPAILAT